MAKIERIINKDFDQLLSTIEDGIINGSVSASLEDASACLLYTSPSPRD